MGLQFYEPPDTTLDIKLQLKNFIRD